MIIQMRLVSDKRVGEYRYTNIKTKNWGKVGTQLCNELAYSYRTDDACQFITETYYQDGAYLARQLDKCGNEHVRRIRIEVRQS